MKSLAAATTARRDTGTAVPARYTWEQVKTTLTDWRAAGASLRGVAKRLNEQAGPGQVVITHRVVQRILAGHEPHNSRIRAALRLPPFVAVAACVCGEVHLRRGRCPNAPKPQTPAWVTAAADLLAARERLTPPAVRVYGRGGKAVTW